MILIMLVAIITDGGQLKWLCRIHLNSFWLCCEKSTPPPQHYIFLHIYDHLKDSKQTNVNITQL